VRDLAARLPRQLELLGGRGIDPRHRSLRAAIDWSYELLEPSQQLLLRRLGIFAGGFTLEAAEEICCGSGDDLLPSDDAVYLNLAELVAKSLVTFDRERSRYRLLEPIRQFSRQLLETSDEIDIVAERHATWAIRRTRETFGVWIAGDGGAPERFREELDNVHAALDWMRDHDRLSFLRMVATLGVVWFQTDWRRGRATADLALSVADDVSGRLRAGVLLSRGIVEERDDLDASGVWIAEARELYLRERDAFGVAGRPFSWRGRVSRSVATRRAAMPWRQQNAFTSSVSRWARSGPSSIWATTPWTLVNSTRRSHSTSEPMSSRARPVKPRYWGRF
jgi:hypothetical protein